MKQTYHICSRSAAETEALGRALGAVVRPGTVFTLTGDLGAGKSVFSRGMAPAAGVFCSIHIPSFDSDEDFPRRARQIECRPVGRHSNYFFSSPVASWVR